MINTGLRERINRQGGPRGALPDGREREGGGRPEAEGPKRPARPRGREGRLSPQPPGLGPRRDPLTPGRGPGRRARTFSKPLAPVHVAAWRAVRVRTVRTSSATRCTRTGKGSGPRSAPCARTQNGAGRSRPRKWARSRRSSPAPGRAARRSRSKTRRGPPDRRCAGAASRRGDVSAGAAALSLVRSVVLLLAVVVMMPFFPPFLAIIYIYIRRPLPPFALLYAPRQSTASARNTPTCGN